MIGTKYLYLYSQDMDRKSFDEYIQAWCLSSAGSPVDFRTPRMGSSRLKLIEKFTTLKDTTIELLLQTFAFNVNRKSTHTTMSMLIRYLPETLTARQLEILWEGSCFDALSAYYCGRARKVMLAPEELQTFYSRCVALFQKYADTDTTTEYAQLKRIIGDYVREIKNPEQFEELFRMNKIAMNRILLNKETCPMSIVAACADKEEYMMQILEHASRAPGLALAVIQRFQIPVISYLVQNILTSPSIAERIVVEVRNATEDDIANQRTLKDRIEWFEQDQDQSPFL